MRNYIFEVKTREMRKTCLVEVLADRKKTAEKRLGKCFRLEKLTHFEYIKAVDRPKPNLPK